MSDIGYIQIRAFTSNAQIPLKDVAIAVTDSGNSAIALRLTNRNGALDQPIAIQVPSPSAGQAPNTGVIPFTSVNIHARIPNFEQIQVEHVQVFPNTVTVQALEFIPLSEYPDSFNELEIFETSPQNL